MRNGRPVRGPYATHGFRGGVTMAPTRRQKHFAPFRKGAPFMFPKSFTFAALQIVLALIAPGLVTAQSVQEVTVAGPQANAQAGIQASVDAFRNALGNPNNGNTPGPLASGRREITWD